MIDYEIEAILKVVDRASPDLRRVIGLSREAAASMERLDQVELRGISAFSLSGLEKNLRAINRALPLIERSLGKLAGAFDGAFGSAAGKVDAVAASVERLNASLAGTAAAARTATSVIPTPIRNVSGGGSGGRGGRHGGVHLHGSQHIGGGIGASWGVTPGMAALGALGYGLYSNSMLEDSIVNIMFTSGVPWNLKDKARAAKIHDQLRDLIQNASTSTGSPTSEMSAAAASVARMMSGYAPEKRLAVMKPTLEFAAQEHRLKGVSYEEGAESILGIMHILQNYDPKTIERLMKSVGYLSFVTPSSMPQYTNALSYIAPMVAGGLMKSEQAINNMLIFQAAMQRAGIRQGKAGTWTANMLYGALSGSVTISGHAAGKQLEALKALGLVANGKSTVMTPEGDLDLMAISDRLRTAKLRMASQPGMFEVRTKQAMGAQGSRAGEFLASDVVAQQISAIRKEMENAPSADSYFSQAGKDSPAQKARVAIADLAKTLQDLARTITPEFVTAVKGIDAGLKVIDSFILKFTPENRIKSEGGISGKTYLPSGIRAYPSWWPNWLKDPNLIETTPQAHKSSYVPSQNAGNGGFQNVSLVVDGRKLGDVLLARMSGEMSGPQTGYSGFDGRMHQFPVRVTSI